MFRLFLTFLKTCILCFLLVPFSNFSRSNISHSSPQNFCPETLQQTPPASKKKLASKKKKLSRIISGRGRISFEPNFKRVLFAKSFFACCVFVARCLHLSFPLILFHHTKTSPTIFNFSRYNYFCV